MGSDGIHSVIREQLFPQIKWITEQSWRIGCMGQLENPIAYTLRNFVTRVTPTKLVRKPLEKAAGYEL